MPESALEHVPVIDNSVRQDGTFARENFRYDHGTDTYACPAGKTLTTTGTLVNGPHHAKGWRLGRPNPHRAPLPEPGQARPGPYYSSIGWRF
jgi:hypothetical protein